MKGKIVDPAGPWPDGRTRWKQLTYKVRVIEYRIPGFRRVRLITNLLDPAIPAIEIARHYHSRWEVELVYDSVKTHQSGTRTGQCHTVLRSKRPDLVQQEILASLTAYNLIRHLINEAAGRQSLAPRSISFVDAVQTIINCIPPMRRMPTERLPAAYEQLLVDVARCQMKRWRRPRKYPRVVKVKMSNFKLKRPNHRGVHWDPANEVRILGAAA